MTSRSPFSARSFADRIAARRAGGAARDPAPDATTKAPAASLPGGTPETSPDPLPGPAPGPAPAPPLAQADPIPASPVARAEPAPRTPRTPDTAPAHLSESPAAYAPAPPHAAKPRVPAPQSTPSPSATPRSPAPRSSAAPEPPAPQSTAPKSSAPQSQAPHSRAPQSPAPQATAPEPNPPEPTVSQTTAPRTAASQSARVDSPSAPATGTGTGKGTVTGKRVARPRPPAQPPTAPRNHVPTTVLTPQPPEGALRLVPLQALAKGGKWRTEAMRSYRMPVLLWFTRGQGRITLAGLKRGYGAHNAIFIPPRTMHGFEVTAQVYGTAVFFSEEPSLPLPQRPLHLRVRDGIAQGEVTTILEQLGREIDGDRPERARAVHHHAGLLSVWLDRQVSLTDDTAPDTAALRLVRRFTERVEAQLYTAQGVSDYAEALGVTPTHLSRVCRETCGRSASDILADRLTFEARRLLAETTLPVKQVARILGYGSAAYFTRAFQSRTGQTPTQFRAAA